MSIQSIYVVTYLRTTNGVLLMGAIVNANTHLSSFPGEFFIVN